MIKGYRITWAGIIVGLPDVIAFRDGLPAYGLTPVGAPMSRVTLAGTWYGLPCEEGLLVAYRRGNWIYIELLVLTQALNLAGLKAHAISTLTLGNPQVLEDIMTLNAE